MFYFNINKLTSLNKFAINKLNSLGKLSLSKREKIVYPLIFVSIILALFIVDIANKQIADNQSKIKNRLLENSELIAIKKFIINNIKSPFENINYRVKKGDTLVKILKNHQIKNQDIDKAISEFKKHNKSSNIMCGFDIFLTIRNNKCLKENSLESMSIPISKSATIEVYRDEHKELISEKMSETQGPQMAIKYSAFASKWDPI